MNLSTHFTLEEAIFSSTAARLKIDNYPKSQLTVTSMKNTAECMEKVRSLLDNKPIHIDSFYRCPQLNSAVGSSTSSQHLRGEAVDFLCNDFGTPLEICRKLISSKLSYDQLILEHNWVHISFKSSDDKNRMQVLSLLKSNRYARGLTDSLGKPY